MPGFGLSNSSADLVEEEVGATNGEIVRETQDRVTLGAQPRVASSVVGLLLRFVVRRPVEFDDQARSRTEEIHDIRADRRLAAKFGAAEARAT